MSKLIISKPYNECQQNRAVTQEAAVVPVAKPQMKESIGHFILQPVSVDNYLC